MAQDLLPTHRMISLDAHPRLARQVHSSGPILLWRDRPGGGREGLLLFIEVCPFPGCPLRHVDVTAYRTDDSLVKVELDGGDVRTRHRTAGAARPRLVLGATVDLDAVRVDDVSAEADGDSLTWLRAELDGELLAELRRRFERERCAIDWPSLRGSPRPGGNDPCPCGSGRRFGACCSV